MKQLSIQSLITNSKHFLAAATLGASLCLAMILASSMHANAQQVTTNAKAQVGEVAAPADPIRACGPVPKDKDASRWGKYFKVNGVNMHRTPSTHSKVCGQGQKSHKVDYHCWKRGSDGHTWTYVRDVTTRYAGWVIDRLLVRNGSLVHC
jgi:hypothetical protein